MYRAPGYTPPPRPPVDFPAEPPPAPRPEPPRRPRRASWRLIRWSLIGLVWGAIGLTVLFVWALRDLPHPETALDAIRRPSLVLEDRLGRTYATFGDVVGDPLRLPQMARCLPPAIVAVEDRRFWEHGGIDPRGLLRAATVNLLAGRVVQGGSTLTQQVAKNLFLTNARTFRRKIQELLLTLWLERHFTKQEILEIYLDRVYLGSGAWGVDAAAKLYFGTSARRLELWQCAVLAGLPRAPSRFNPRTDPDAATARAREVLSAMTEAGAITEAQAKAAAARIHFPAYGGNAGWFADWAAQAAQRVVPEDTDAELRTTLDPRLQPVVESRLAAMLDGPGHAAGAGQGAVVVLDAATGQVRAMAGGRDWHQSSFNRAVLARRQPGSAFKPFVWLTALEHGARPDDTVLDAPIHVGGWNPVDFEPGFKGEVTLEEALAESLNTPAVRLLLRSGGPEAVASVAHRLGIADTLPRNASLALGTGEVGVLEMAAAYASFFNGGYAVTPTAILGGEADHQPLAVPAPEQRRVIDPDLAAMMVRMLGAVVARGTGHAAAVPGRFVGGKTGTTQDSRDAWFIGTVNGTVIAVWLGNDDDRPMRGVTGGSLPATLFHQIALAVR
ncbi:MAG TPA: PBP1A family penicillin-binding protein [Acetobacteraceae bacterium]|nr:PBP1A family penicillin-binding protein [Acetobacteraceae bacterium]